MEMWDQPDQYRTALLLEFLPSRHCGYKCVPGWPLLPRHEWRANFLSFKALFTSRDNGLSSRATILQRYFSFVPSHETPRASQPIPLSPPNT